MSNARTKARRNVVQALYQWQLSGGNLADIQAQFLSEYDMKKVDVDYFKELFRQVPLHLHELDDHLLPFLDRPVDEVDPVERAILRIAAYELGFCLDVPYRVVINESVELAKRFGAEHGHKYVNGVVDQMSKKMRATEMQSSSSSEGKA